MTFQLEASSDTLDLLQGTLILGDKKFVVTAVFVEPQLPPAHIVMESGASRSGAQTKISIVFDDDPPGNTRGLLRVGLNTAGSLSDDPGLCFLDNKERAISFEVRKGERRAIFSSAPYTILQTGTTAATAVLNFTAANRSELAYLYFPPLPVQIDFVRATRGTNTLEVVLTGFDNTRLVGGDIFFTFYDRNGVSIPAGIYSKVALGDSFTNYFRSSNAGGVFELRTVFPVSGDASAVSSVAVQIANVLASTRTDRTPFQ